MNETLWQKKISAISAIAPLYGMPDEFDFWKRQPAIIITALLNMHDAIPATPTPAPALPFSNKIPVPTCPQCGLMFVPERATPAPALEAAVDYEAMLRKLNMLVNPVTAAHRHGQPIKDMVSKRCLDNLCNYQIECEAALGGNEKP